MFDFALKTVRAYFVDVAGARIDREVGETVFARLLSIRLDKKKGSTGALAGVVRELETLRDFFASATLTAMVDVPFIVITLAVIAVIGGPLVFVRSEEHTSELQSLMRISYAVLCLYKNNQNSIHK